MIYAFSVWVTLTLVVLGLVAYRYFVSLKEDDIVHLADSEAPLIREQTALSSRLDRLDEWRRRLTLVDALFGLGLAAVFIRGALKGSGLL